MKPFGLVVGLVPWILFSLIAGHLGAQAVGYAALAAFLGSLVLAVRGMRADGLKLVDAAGTVTFGFLTAVGLTGGEHVQRLLVDYGRGGATLLLAVVMCGSAFTVPFTEQYARASIDRRYWGSPVFRAVNRRISLLWAAVVAVMAGCHLLAGALGTGNLLLNWVAPVLLIWVGYDRTRTLAGRTTVVGDRAGEHAVSLLTGRPGAVERPTRAAWLTLIAMTSGFAMIMLDQTVVTVALPTMAADLRLSGGGQQWVVNAYVLALAATVAIGGRLGAKLGPVTTFRLGVAVFFASSALCGLAPTGAGGEAWIIAARVAQGCGAALMMPVGASIVMAAFPSSVRGRAIGTYVGIGQLFLALGPLVGGALTEWVTWRAVFWINVPVGAAALWLVRRARPANPAQPGLTVPATRAALLVTGVTTTVYALQQSSRWGWYSSRTLGILAAGLAVTAVFVATQLRSRDPLVKLGLLRHRGFNGNLVVLLAAQFGMLGLVLFSSLYAQNLLGYGPVVAGCAALSFVLPLMAGAQIAGRWYDRSGPRPPLLTGLALATAGTLLWAATLPRVEYAANVPGMALLGLGLGLVFSPVNTDALSRVPAADRPQASGIVQTVRQLGGTLGVAVIGAVILAQEHVVAPADRLNDVAEAMRAGFLVAAGAFAAGLVAGWALLARDRPDPAG